MYTPIIHIEIDFCKVLNRNILMEHIYMKQIDRVGYIRGCWLHWKQNVDNQERHPCLIFKGALQSFLDKHCMITWFWKIKWKNALMKSLQWESHKQIALSFCLFLPLGFFLKEHKGVSDGRSTCHFFPLCSFHHVLLGDRSKWIIYFAMAIFKLIPF